MFGFMKKCFSTGLMFLSSFMSVNLLSAAPLNAIPLSCILMNNQERKVRLQIVNVNGDDPVFFLYSVKRSKCSSSCNNINNQLAKLCVPDVVKNLNVQLKCSI